MSFAAAEHHAQARSTRAAFRLAIIVIAIVAALVLLPLLFRSTFLGASTAAQTRATQATMASYAAAISTYQANHGAAPPSLQTLVTSGFILTLFPDAWQQPFDYTVPGPAGRPFALTSRGPDRLPGTDDDLDHHRPASSD